jgi:hypothetical protein
VRNVYSGCGVVGLIRLLSCVARVIKKRKLASRLSVSSKDPLAFVSSVAVVWEMLRVQVDVSPKYES